MDRQKFEDFLRNSDCDFVITAFNLEAPETFTAEIKTKADENLKNDYPAFCTEWLRKFSIFSQTNWIVRRTFPNVKHLIFKKRYVCQHSAKNKRSLIDKSSVRNKQCPAKIDFIVKFKKKDIYRRDKMLQKGLNVTIIIVFTHTHELKMSEASKFLRCDPEVNEQFIQYFEQGMTPVEARAHHQTKLIANNVAPEVLENVQINPSKEHVYYLHRRWKKTWFIGHKNDSDNSDDEAEDSCKNDMTDKLQKSIDPDKMMDKDDKTVTLSKYEKMDVNCDPVVLDSTEQSTSSELPNLRQNSEEFTNEFVQAMLNLQYAFCEFSSNMTVNRNTASLAAMQNMTRQLCSLKTPEQVNELFKSYKVNKSDSAIEKDAVKVKIETID